MEFVKSVSVPITDLKNNSKIFFEILEEDKFLKVAKLKGTELIFEDDNKFYFFTPDKELYFYFKDEKRAVR